MIILSVLLLAAIFCIRKDCEEGMGKDKLLPVRGILCVFIVLHHVYGVYSDALPKIFVVYNNIGFWIVSMFFFFSGYGLSISAQKKTGYLSMRFIKSKFSKVLVPSLIISLMYIAVYSFTGNFSFHRWWILASHGQCIPTSHWFLYILFIQYVFFYFCYRHKCRNSLLSYIICTLILMFVLYLISFPSIWYKSTLFMPLGMVYYEWTQKRSVAKYLSIICIGLLCCFAYGFIADDIVLIKMAGNVLISCVVIVFFLVFIGHYSLKNKLWNIIGHNSLYVYLLHQPVLDAVGGVGVVWSELIPVIVMGVSLSVAVFVKKIIRL